MKQSMERKNKFKSTHWRNHDQCRRKKNGSSDFESWITNQWERS